ncbi:hypothetical protein HMSSN139_44210 [Paenibacillus sp. HMSSN-139]|nr:hypothetical protein HMSSN139_44210 [Paenibacillus sp. HMSSN-139]
MEITQEPVVRMRDVSKRIGGKTLIDRLTLDIPRGQVYGFLGPERGRENDDDSDDGRTDGHFGRRHPDRRSQHQGPF